MSYLLNDFSIKKSYNSANHGSALLFDGINEAINTNTNNIDFTDGVNDLPFTLIIKFKADTFSGGVVWIFGKNHPTNFTSISECYNILLRNNGKCLIYIGGSPSRRWAGKQTSYQLSTNTVYTIVGTYDGTFLTNGYSSLDLYVNNNNSGLNNVAGAAYNGMVVKNIPIGVGGRYGGTQSLNGEIYYGAIYNRVLTPFEISKINNGANPINIKGLIYYNNYNQYTYWDGTNIKSAPIYSIDYNIGQGVNMEDTDILK